MAEINYEMMSNSELKIKLTETFNGGGSYVTPSVKVLEIASEGLLCGSLIYDTADYGYDNAHDLGEI